MSDAGEVVKVFAVYGPGQVFTLALWPDGRFVFDLQGNVPPVFAAVEMGAWRGADAAEGAALFAEVAEALPRTASNARPEPDSAFLEVKREVAGALVGRRMVDLYAPPPVWNVVQARLLGLAQGPWLAQRARTVAAVATWDTEAAAARRPVLDVAFAATGTEALTLPTPAAPGSWTISLLPAGLTPAQREAFPSEILQDEMSVIPSSPTGGAWLAMKPGDGFGVRVEINRQLPPGRWNATVAWTAADPGWGRHPKDRLSGRFNLDPGPLTIFAPR